MAPPHPVLLNRNTAGGGSTGFPDSVFVQYYSTGSIATSGVSSPGISAQRQGGAGGNGGHTGVSNGGIFCRRLAAEASDLVAAIAPVIGGMAEPIAERFRPAFPVSMLAIQGDADPLVPFGGGEIGLWPSGRRGRIIPTMEMVSKYLTLNGIVGEPNAASLPDLDPQDGTTTEVTRYPAGPRGFLVELYVVHGGGHQWPGHGRSATAAFSGKASRDFDATEVIWEFFRSCPPRSDPPTDAIDSIYKDLGH